MSMLTILYEMQEELMRYVKTVQRQLDSMLVDSLAVIDLFWSLDLKSSSTELKITNQMDLGQNCRKNVAEFRRIRSSVLPVPWREEH